jgi:hypothetical protein
MKIEIEMNTESTDVSQILQKVSQIVESVKGQGFTIKELEIESDEEE